MATYPQVTPKTVLVTGCSDGGIGSSLAAAFQARGLHVFATARHISGMSKLQNLPNVTLLALDVTSQESLDAAAAAVAKKTGGTMDYLVNNGGIAGTGPAIDLDIDLVRQVIETNFIGTVRACKTFGPMILRSRGTIVNNCSTSAHALPPWVGIYSASKAAQEAYSETLRLELPPHGVKVVSIMIGGISTNMTTKVPIPEMGPGALFKLSDKRLAELKAMEAGDGPEAKLLMPPNTFAKKVVNDVLGGATGRIWRGGMANALWFMLRMPQSAFDKLIWSLRGDWYVLATE